MVLKVIENKLHKSERIRENSTTTEISKNVFENKMINLKDNKKNVLYITIRNYETNFFRAVKSCSFSNIVEKII